MSEDLEKDIAERESVSRRDFLKMAGVAGAAMGAAGGLVAACGPARLWASHRLLLYVKLHLGLIEKPGSREEVPCLPNR